MKYFNIHKHRNVLLARSREIINKYSHFDQIPKSGFFSTGLHPWYLDHEKMSGEWELLQKICKSENIVAVGECGLDKVCKTDWYLQEEWFAKQIELANMVNKPLIIHCVRAFDEVLLMLKKSKVNVPVIFHGFSKSLELAHRILAEGFYLSFGKHLIDNSAVQVVFAETPLDKLFLETDAAPIQIDEVYEAASAIKEMEIQDLCLEIEKNIIKVFGEKIAQTS